MIILLNSTKTMDLTGEAPVRPAPTRPDHLEAARELAAPLAGLSAARLGELMGVTGPLAARTRADLALWGAPDRPRRPAMLAFTGLVYKYLDARSLTVPQWNRAQKTVRILSGLYGLLRPLDEVEAYRLEMGCKVRPRGAKNLTEFWRARITDALNEVLKEGEPVLNLASREYVKALDPDRLRGPVISPVFQERRPDGSLRNAPVHAKMARGALARFALTAPARTPDDLLAFDAMDWAPLTDVPAGGPWVFTRPHRPGEGGRS